MSSLPNSVVLRPRFKIELDSPSEHILKVFEKGEYGSFSLNKLDEHIFIKLTPKYRHFWSPQLHLEVQEVDEKSSILHGLFGPNPTLWTFFMFLHFAVALCFIGLGIWAYSNNALGHDYGIQVGGMVFLTILWFVFYFFGVAGKKKGRPQMEEMFQFMQDTLEDL